MKPGKPVSSAVKDAHHARTGPMGKSTRIRHPDPMPPRLPAGLRLGPVHITVTDLDRSSGFYERSIGLREHRREDGTARLGAGGEDLLVLHEEQGAREAGRHAGLYHFALLHPSRAELGRAARRLLETRTPISGASDHGISEAIYLPDPDDNGIELAADRPRERWGDLRDPGTSAPTPLDMHDLLEQVAGEDPQELADDGLAVGHLHLHVGDIDRALGFYRDVVGFEPMTLFPSAAFIAAGGYHHHLGLNTWRGEGVPPAPDGTVGLREWTILLPNDDDVAELRERVEAAGLEADDSGPGIVLSDPWRNRVRVARAGSSANGS
jgi:catechol 2,3-dioxygenase